MSVLGRSGTLASVQAATQEQTIYYTTDAQPGVDERVIVITSDYRCLGYMDKTGTWHYASDGAPIENVVGWTRKSRP